VLEVGAADAYLQHVLRVHAADIEHTHPDFRSEQLELPGVSVYLVEKGAETVGVVVIRAQDKIAHVLLDYVTPRFRDFTPGRFVWRQSGLLREHGFTRVVAPANALDAREYYGRIGFQRETDCWVLAL
jgi:hypothetical protein